MIKRTYVDSFEHKENEQGNVALSGKETKHNFIPGSTRTNRKF